MRLIETEYEALWAQLSRRLQSREKASEVLHDIYIKLGNEPSVGDIADARSYIVKAAVNIEKNRTRREQAFPISGPEILSCYPDHNPDPEQEAGAKLEVQRLLSALNGLPVQRRTIFLARWRDNKTQTEIADDLGIHKRTVQKELSRAEALLRSTLNR